MILSQLHDSISMVCPITGVSLKNDKITIHFSDSATDEQKRQAQVLVDALDLAKERAQKHAIDRVQAFMDAKAKEYGYDHILSASSYVTSTFPKFKAEGIAFAKWRDDVWLYCYSVLAEWEAGTSIITTEDELIASLPEFIVEY